ncbi:NUDIX hydrolase [Lactococcus nasutitermitis]|uniref:NUDIX hydrolase n=1 Tax=Lactococcus nasutitermitis TaxID=1652957 RepID=A0ABV9JFI9_9LACT|nr:NUDIX domain-containing protein [Lactococcus nasutitermitis]
MGYIEDLRADIGHRPIIMVGSLLILENEAGQMLLQKRTYTAGNWGFPGGLMEFGENTEETAVREMQEETGLIVKNLELFGVYTKKEMTHLANGDTYQGVNVVYRSHDFQGKMKIDETESLRFDWFDRDKLPERIVPISQLILADLLGKGKTI